MGYERKDSYRDNLEWQALHHHLPIFLKPSSIPVELHWNIVSQDYFSDVVIDPQGLWEISQTVHIGNIETLGLCNEDILLHLSFHACVHRFDFGLLPLIDIAHVASGAGNMAWPELISRSYEWNVHRSLYLILRLAKELVGADIPSPVLSDLRPADFDEPVFSEARELIFADPTKVKKITPGMTQWHNRGLWGRIAQIFRQIFVPRIKIAEKYTVSPRSVKLYWYYLVRAKGLLFKYFGTILGFQQKDRELTSIARFKSRLDNYLDVK